ncbi:hypothetical protein GCK72_025220 [Caenorhabditis remanei]|nr:hypothetical protein GCK72_025220 [Caenorhabditis remanei]KAF1748753.1 hypothetical protein GCK72_025220 [Caenorhabditis remanei]
MNLLLLCLVAGSLAYVSTTTYSRYRNASAHESIVLNAQQLREEPMLKITRGLEPLKALTEKKLVLTCDVLYRPAATIMWTFNELPIQGDLEISMEDKIINMDTPVYEAGNLRSTLTIECPSTADTGVYRCITTNGIETVSSAAWIEFVSSGDECKSNGISGPVITQWSYSRFEYRGNAAILVCRADRPAEWIWKNADNETIETGGRFEILPNGDLLIQNISWADMGPYFCTARNEFGESGEVTFLYPFRAPRRF